MENVRLATLNTKGYNPTSSELWFLSNVFGEPTCSNLPTWTQTPNTWAWFIVFFLLILLIPLVFCSGVWAVFWIFLVVIIIWWIINSCGNQMVCVNNLSHCQI